MYDLDKIWKDVSAGIKSEITGVEYTIWFEGLKPICLNKGALIVLAPSAHNKQTFIKSYLGRINSYVSTGNFEVSEVKVIDDSERSYFLSDEDFQKKEEEKKEEENRKTEELNKNKAKFTARYTFDNFVVGESNKFAFHAAQSVANNPGSASGYLSFNPLFIYGGVGLGKTHLLHAIGNHITENSPELKILYVPTENLTNDYVEAISNNSSGDKSAFNFKSFRDKYRSVDVLMLDDVQFLQKRTGLQEMVFHIFNDLYQHGKQIILTSDRPPVDIATLEDRLRSRFEGGLLVDIGTPNLDMRIAIIKKKMMLQKFAINDEVVEYLAEQFDTNIRELEGALSKVILYSSLLGTASPNLRLAKEALRITENKKTGIDSEDIINACCGYYHINKSDMVGKKKTKDIAEARMVAIYLIRSMLSLPLVTIGQIFGGRDHTTILYSADKIASDLQSKREIALKIKDIKALLNT